MREENPGGILIVDKPKGITSHDVVNIVRGLFEIRKVGHAGSLDPIATGVLVVLVGEATKRSHLLAHDDKGYTVRLRLGVTTDTADAFGKVISTCNPVELDTTFIEKTIMSFECEIEQLPPMFSAVKFKGRSLYKWARKGITVPRKPRRVTIRKIQIKEMLLPNVIFDITCSKGTYVRQLCADIGERLGCGGHMAELRRTRSGNFDISKAVGVNRLKTLGTDELRGLLL